MDEQKDDYTNLVASVHNANGEPYEVSLEAGGL